VHRFVGFNYRLTNIQAAICLAQVETAAAKIERRREIAHAYKDLLADVPGLTLPNEADWAKSVYWMYGILIDQDVFGRNRIELAARLAEYGIDTRDFFFPLHRQPVFCEGDDPRYPDTSGAYPVSDDLYARGLYLPSGLGLTEDQIGYVAETLIDLRR
jgi:perosamine synthetase